MLTNIVLKNELWNAKKQKKMQIETREKKIKMINNTREKEAILYSKVINIKDKRIKGLKVQFKGEVENAGGYLLINESLSIPINSEVSVPLAPPVELHIRMFVNAESSIEFEEINMICTANEKEEENFINKVDQESSVLVIVPNYPSYENLYYSAFAHSRNKEYIKNAIKIQVVSVSETNWYQTIYIQDGIPVYRCDYNYLKKILSKHQYKVIIVHFVDERLYPIFDGYVHDDEELIFIVHGPETTFRYLVNVARPYFTPEIKYPVQSPIYDIKEQYVKKYAQKQNVHWIFISEWLKNFSQKEMNIEFKNCSIINNVINEEIFPYKKKTEKQRCNILVIRKFDNFSYHAIDQMVLTIMELSKRPFFQQLEFEIYGDGNYYDELIRPLLQFKNVHLHRTFIPNNQIYKIHEKSGIMLIPSRHDSQGVSMCEAASSGVIPVGTDVAAIPYFINNEKYHILAESEKEEQLADIIERLYKNPKEFLEISEGLSKEIREKCCKKNTVDKEISIIKEKMQSKTESLFEKICKQKRSNKPTLTIAIPAYNVEAYLDKCLYSILNHRNASKTEVLIINDGSKDNTLKIAKKYEKKCNGIVRVIDKQNGGHGSTINVAIKEAKGKYIRIIDSDDWVDSENLSKLVDIMETAKADIILTKGSYEYVEQPKLVNIISYDNIQEGKIYRFDDLIYKGYGFNTYGPLLTTGNYRTETLRKANFKISEKKPYVDMEFNAFSLQCVETLQYFNLDIYRYLIGREGQTVSSAYWKKKYKDHIYVIFNIIKTVYKNDEFSESKKQYIFNNLLAPMVDSQIYMFDALCLWKDIDKFLDKLKQYPEIYEVSIKFIEEKQGNCQLILRDYKKKLGIFKMNKPIIIPGFYENIYDVNIMSMRYQLKNIKYSIIKIMKIILPNKFVDSLKKIKR